MRYILKYKLKSKYFNFVREYYKEFENKKNIFNFITNNEIIEWQIYEKKDIKRLYEKQRDIS